MMNIHDAALRHLSSRSRTVQEMKKHLAGKGFEDEDISQVIESLEEYGYLNDESYCREYFRYAFGKGKGRQKVFQELREKGIGSDLAEIAFEDFLAEEGENFDERKRALEEAQKVLRLAEIGEGEPVPEKILGRIARKLQSKGYGSDTIYSIIGQIRG